MFPLHVRRLTLALTLALMVALTLAPLALALSQAAPDVASPPPGAGSAVTAGGSAFWGPTIGSALVQIAGILAQRDDMRRRLRALRGDVADLAKRLGVVEARMTRSPIHATATEPRSVA